jgi:hypothetical protein
MRTLREIRDLLTEIRDLLAQAERRAARTTEVVVSIDSRLAKESMHRPKGGLGVR